MRRRDRELTDINEIKSFINKEEIVRIGFTDEQGVYIVPVNYAVSWEDNMPTFYFHGAKKGRKASIVDAGPAKVGFEIDGNHQVVVHDEGCTSTFKYMSIIGTGTVTTIEDDDEKRAVLDMIMEHFGGKASHYPASEVNRTRIYKLTVDEYSAKANK